MGLTMMRLRLVLLTVLTALALNPCLARNAHPQHGAHANSATNGASGSHPTGVNPAPANIPIDTEPTVAPPVLPSHGIMQQQIHPLDLNGKAVSPGNLPRGQTGATTIAAPIPRNAIGQSAAPARNFVGAQPIAGLQRPGATAPPILHGAIAAPPAVSSATRLNFANAINRGGVTGAAVIRPIAVSSGIGGPARAAYGINGTTVQSKP